MTRVFISYSHKDEAWKDRLQTQLAVLEMEGLLSVWEDRQIALGDSWYPEIETALNTADVAILLISADFLTSKFIRGEEIPRLLERREQQGICVIPLILKPCPWKKVGWLNAMQGASRDNVPLSTLVEHQQDDILCKLAEKIHDLVGTCRLGFSPTISPTTPSIHSDRLPIVKGGFFGRTAELQLLNDAWQEETLTPQPPLPRSGRGGGRTRIIQFIAPGGTGKTKLLRHWLDHTADIPVLIAWSFYSQGASEDKQTSATPFFSHAFAKLGSTRERFASEEDKGDHLAELLHGKRYVLVLDGLEPLQHGGAAMRGALKDKAIRQLLRQLARHPCGLCIITTRIALHELSDRDAPSVIRHDLQNLTAADGIQLLQSLGVKGSAAELGKAVREYGGHALALSLLGNVLRLRHQGDVRKRDTLKALVKATGNRDSRHAFKVMQAYAEWFAGEPELALLHLLGLFDHPIGQDVLQMLWDAQIPHLTADIDEDEWLEAIASLREEHHLLSQQSGGGDLDCHPLIREYFGGQLQTQQPQAWQQAHERLYGYYKALPENPLPDTLEEMQPLFSAGAHGCAAGLHQQALEEVYWPRIRRKQEAYIVKKLGAFSDDLATVAHFFTTPWHTPAAGLTEADKAWLLNQAGFCLRALGRLREALEPMQASLDMLAKQGDWKQAAAQVSNLSELQLTLGEVAQAQASSQRSVGYADQAGDMFERMSDRTAHADALHQAGATAAALALFREAEQLQQEDQPEYPRLYSLRGFRYCDLLLTQGSTAEVLERAEQTLGWVTTQNWLLDIALDQLTLGRAHLQQAVEETPPNLPLSGEGQEAAEGWLDQAVAGLRAAGYQQMLPHGLLARAALHRHTRDFARARQDLQEVFDIAEPSGMRLFLTDYHLEMARLLVAESLAPFPPCGGRVGEGGNSREAADPAYHIAAAAKLINETGYHRRDKELEELQGLSLRI
ncbi:MAG TPA: toll/interleukin-1 receptor domain-containing protein [Candidatus Thiothrix moscowensis]|uniref:toll/interleukin-1 receptor domain-containing protein n=1 Tax=unclassified Thiothrix TaxID=2636184 RepID=UPI0025DBCC26|nr:MULTISPECIES: toll/interleukin-1 receptor domain-containing protein [unclassified Thiothrix]HRJ53985.1 toll/interleukin-1 receptor domain-containing protein [Candidatus Thiothrix moscowensis]HRJ94067.1 toll/interleukin-1 receptor domain-containing protein [Candidatus Thiothrix moscowensis]